MDNKNYDLIVEQCVRAFGVHGFEIHEQSGTNEFMDYYLVHLTTEINSADVCLFNGFIQQVRPLWIVKYEVHHNVSVKIIHGEITE